jgi:hypothetical protein
MPRHALVLIVAMAARCAALRTGVHVVKHVRPRAAAARMAADDDLMASLRARMNKEGSGAPAPLGPDEVGADQMGPADVVDYIMRSLAAGNEPEADNGLRVLMGFSVAYDDGQQEDTLGQVQPGCFSSPDALRTFLASGRYEPLCDLEEWKPMGTPDMSNMSRQAAQKLLVRRDGDNWKDFFINLTLGQAVVGERNVPRWLVSSIYMSGQ